MMTKHCKFWLCFAGGVAMLAVLVLILSQAQRTKGTLSPPPGPHKAGDVWVANLGGRTTMAMVWCPPGKFLMGSPVSEKDRQPDETQHEVILTQGFWLGKYEVTQAQWSAIMRTTPSFFFRKEIIRWKVWKWQIPVWRKDFLASHLRLPVERLKQNDCQEFCQKAGIGFRLPTEAEWEYACRAEGCAPFNGSGILNELGWYDGNSGGKTHPVGRKQPNAWGLYDMHGNVQEWCQNPIGTVNDHLVSSEVYRGGDCFSKPKVCRAANQGNNASWSFSVLGFRVALAPAVPTPANRKTPTPQEPL